MSIQSTTAESTFTRPIARLALVTAASAVLVTTSSVAAVASPTDLAAAGAGHHTASCKQWKITGKWISGQSNANRVTYHFVQRKTHLSGYATLPPEEAAQTGFGYGKLAGTMIGTRAHYIVTWKRSTVDGIVHRGDYHGKVTKARMAGTSQDLSDPGSTATFVSRGPTSCLKR